MMRREEKLNEMGIVIQAPPKPLAAYVPALRVGDYVYTSGQLPMENGQLRYHGKVGAALTQEEGYAAAKLCAINCLSAVKSVAGDLEQVEQIVKVTGFVNSAPGFSAQPAVINGASELFGAVFGDAGTHARAAVGVAELPLDAAVEVEIIVKLKA